MKRKESKIGKMCIICGREIGIGRPGHSLTCRSECSKTFERVNKYIRGRIRWKNIRKIKTETEE